MDRWTVVGFCLIFSHGIFTRKNWDDSNEDPGTLPMSQVLDFSLFFFFVTKIASDKLSHWNRHLALGIAAAADFFFVKLE